MGARINEIFSQIKNLAVKALFSLFPSSSNKSSNPRGHNQHRKIGPQKEDDPQKEDNLNQREDDLDKKMTTKTKRFFPLASQYSLSLKIVKTPT